MKRGFYQRFWEYRDSVTSNKPKSCFICGMETHRIDLNYTKFLHRHCIHIADQGANKNV